MIFQHNKRLALQAAVTFCCEGPLNHWHEVVKLDEPTVWGGATDNPTVMTHKARVSCKCGRTKFWVYGTMETARGIACGGGL